MEASYGEGAPGSVLPAGSAAAGATRPLFTAALLVGLLSTVPRAEPGGGSAQDDGYLDSLDMDTVGEESGLDGPDSIPMHGDFSLRYRGRWSASESRNDLLGYLGLDLGEAGHNPFSFHLRLSARADLAGGDSSNAFDGVLQTFSSQTNGLLYDAYLDAHSFSDLDVARLGRQTDYETPVVAVYDGARAESRRLGGADLQFGGYGGRAVRYYDDVGADPLYGLYLKGTPWRDGRARLDWMHSEDQTLFGSVDDDLFGLSLWQTFDSGLRLEGAYTRLESEDRDLRLLGTWMDPERDFSLRLSYYQLLQSQAFNANEFDPFSYVLGVWQPFTQAALIATQGFGERFDLQGGVDLRYVQDSADVGTYNRDVKRVYLTANLLEFGGYGTGFSLTGEFWRGTGRDIRSWGADLTQPLGSRYRAGLGTYYALYKTDQISGVEREDVRTYFARLTMDLSERTSFELRYQFEQTDFEDFNDIRLRGSWRF